MSNLHYAHTVFIDNESQLDTNWADGINVFCKDTKNIWVLSNGIFYQMSGSTGSGEINTASNIGSGNGIFKQKSGADLQFRSLSGASGVTITTGDTIVFVNSDGYNVIVKSANQDVTNASFTDDTELQFTTEAGATYMVSCDLTISANDATGDYTGRFDVAAGTMSGVGRYDGVNLAGSINQSVMTSAAAANATAFVAGGTIANILQPIGIRLIYSFTCSDATTFKYVFGNQSASGGRTSRTWKGSIMKYKKLS